MSIDHEAARRIAEQLPEKNMEWWLKESDARGEMRELGIPKDADAPCVTMGELARICDAYLDLAAQLEDCRALLHKTEDEKMDLRKELKQVRMDARIDAALRD